MPGCPQCSTSNYFNSLCPTELTLPSFLQLNTSIFPAAVSCPGLVSMAFLLPAPAHFPLKRLRNNQDFQNYVNFRPPAPKAYILNNLISMGFLIFLCFYLNDILKKLYIYSELFENDFKILFLLEYSCLTMLCLFLLDSNL